MKNGSSLWELNPRPPDQESGAIPAKLSELVESFGTYPLHFVEFYNQRSYFK